MNDKLEQFFTVKDFEDAFTLYGRKSDLLILKDMANAKVTPLVEERDKLRAENAELNRIALEACRKSADSILVGQNQQLQILNISLLRKIAIAKEALCRVLILTKKQHGVTLLIEIINEVLAKLEEISPTLERKGPFVSRP